TDRTTLADGTVLQAGQYGPAISNQYPLGKYIEDYEYVQGLGHLDQYNGRTCITPEYPAGTYAYFVTIDSNQMPVYPYTVGAQYYGVVNAGNTGPQGGHNTIPGNATTYTPDVANGVQETIITGVLSVYPNPANDKLYITTGNTVPLSDIVLSDITGREVITLTNNATISPVLNVSDLSAGTYLLQAKAGNKTYITRVLVN
ncbi:MAG TPA: YHYH protein, partial [Chitinophagales bacterium]|nr:YHYH protein [Chitinophagales bacterium]